MTIEETPDPTTATPSARPPGQEIGLREARTRLGELADKARYLDEVTYLTKNGTKVAAVVPFEAARTRDQLRRVQEIAVDELAAMRTDYERLHGLLGQNKSDIKGSRRSGIDQGAEQRHRPVRGCTARVPYGTRTALCVVHQSLMVRTSGVCRFGCADDLGSG